MAHERITFTNRDGVALAALMELPEGPPAGYALLAHCFTCSKDLSSLRRLGRTLCGFGIGVMGFDFTGLGQSEGEFAETGFSSQTSDLVDAAGWLAEHHGAPAVLVGHSLGGTAALYAAREIESVAGVATIGSPSDPAHVEKLFGPDVDEIESSGSAQVDIGGRTFTVKKSFLDDIRSHPPDEWLGDLEADLLILHAPLDNVVGIQNAEELFKATRHPKSFVSLRSADHLLSEPEDAEYAGRIIGAWARTFMGRSAGDDETARDEPAARDLATDHQVAARIGRDRYRVDLRAGRHRMTGDEPEDHGGRDEGPNPYDYLLSALGSCTAITLRMYADRKEWPLDSVTVHLSHEKVEADETDEKTRGGKVDRIERRLEVSGDLSGDQRDRLVKIADMCPVHRTLTGPVRVVTTLMETDG